MIFVLSAPLRFAANPAGSCAARGAPRLASQAKALTSELRNLGANQIKKQLHVNDNQAKQYEKNLTTIESKHAVPACSLFDSSFYSAIDMAHFDPDDSEWAQSYVRILSGFYGILRPYDAISTASLPVTLSTKLTTSKGKHLRDYWREPVLRELEDALRSCPMPVLVDCTSEQDRDVFNLEALPEGTSIHSVEFRLRDSRMNNEARGEFVRWALERRCMTVEELVQFRGYVDDEDPATFRLNTRASNDKEIVFEEAGSDERSWSRKLQESGMTKGAFMAEVAGGKNRYKRAEVKKALNESERKKKRKPTAVY